VIKEKRDLPTARREAGRNLSNSRELRHETIVLAFKHRNFEIDAIAAAAVIEKSSRTE